MKKNFFDFSGGYNDTVESLNLKENEFSEFYNVDPLPNGGFQVRNGTLKLNQTALDDDITQVIEWKLRNGATKTIVIAGKKLYEFSSVLGEFSPVMVGTGENKKQMTVESDTVSYTFFRDYLYFTDGKKMYQWNDEVFYLSNLDEYEHNFKAGDVIKLTVSRAESLFRNETACLIDVRNQMRPNFTYVKRMYENPVNNSDGTGKYKFNTVNGLKYKFVNIPQGTYKNAQDDADNNAKNGIYVLKYSNYRHTGSHNFGYDSSRGDFIDLTYRDRYPFFGSFSYSEADNINNGEESRLTLQIRHDYNATSTFEMYGTANFEKIGKVGDYYQFQSDVEGFYPHNFNYEDKVAYFGNYADLKKIEESDITARIEEVAASDTTIVFEKVKLCKFFCFYAKRQRFLASGNPNEPTAIYVSKLGTFEEWDDTVTIYPDCHLGYVTGLINMYDDVVICFENGFSYLDSELLLADGAESVVEYVPKISSVPVGVMDCNTLCSVPEGIVFYHGENVYLASYSLFGKNYVKMPSQQEFACISRNKCEKILKGSSRHRAVYHDHKYYLYFLDANTEEKILIYDFLYGHWRLYGGISCNGFLSRLKDNRLLIASGKNMLSAFDKDCYSDFCEGGTAPIRFSVKSKYYDLGYDFRRLQTRRLYLVMSLYQPESEDNNVTVSLMGDNVQHEIVNPLADNVLWRSGAWDSRYAWNSEFMIHAFNLNFSTSRIGFWVNNANAGILTMPLVFYSFSLDYDKISEDSTKFRQELEQKVDEKFLNWDAQR